MELKEISEQLGELSSVYLKLTQRARIGHGNPAELEKNLRGEERPAFQRAFEAQLAVFNASL